MASATRPASATAGDHSQTSDATYSAASEHGDWDNLGNVGALDGASSRGGAARQTAYRTKRFDAKGFGFSIPSGATIDGIVANVHWLSVTSGVARIMTEIQVRLLKAGTPGGTNKAFDTSNSDATIKTTTHGGATDLWGQSWSDSDINASTFGIALQYLGGASNINNALIDYVALTVHYTEAAGGATVSVPAGSLTITGYAPTILNPVTVSVPAGSLTLTGYAPTVQTGGATVSVPAGSLTLTGYAPSVLNPQTVSVPLGTLTLTGYAPTVSTAGAGTIVSVPLGTLSLTGYAPTVTVETTIAIPSGSLTLTGYAPAVYTTAGVVIDVPSGSLTLSGFAPTVYVSGGTTTSVFYLPLRAYGDGMPQAVDPAANLENLRSLLPAQRTPFATNSKGEKFNVEPHWYKFFDYLVNQYLGGLTQPTVADIVAALETTMTQATTASQTTALLQQQTQTNAEALSAVVQVANNNALTGAEQIPRVSLSYLEP